jgi:hypothetical protein
VDVDQRMASVDSLSGLDPPNLSVSLLCRGKVNTQLTHLSMHLVRRHWRAGAHQGKDSSDPQESQSAIAWTCSGWDPKPTYI